VPELPEVEITARRLDDALRGATIESALAPGVKVMRTFDPPLSALHGETIERMGRRGKHLLVQAGELTLVMHLMSAGRLQLYDRRAGPRDRTSRLLLRVRPVSGEGWPAAGRPGGARGSQAPGQLEWELRLREFGSKQAAWAKLVAGADLDEVPELASLGPEAWPGPPPMRELRSAPRPLHAALRDQHTIAGIGRSWADEILWEARLSPFKRASELEEDRAVKLERAIVSTLGGAIEHYEQSVSLPIPDKLPMPLRIHRHQGEPCPRCGETLLAVHFEDYVIAYCPACQTRGRRLKDRRMSRLLK
jgi:formamidopyrimidine-DNA glycosylase